MNTRTWPIHTVWAVAVLVIALGAAWGVRSWLGEHDARLRAEEQQKVTDATLKENAATIKQLEADKKAIAAERDKQVADLIKQRNAIHTVQQAVTAMPDLTGLPISSFRVNPAGNMEVEAPTAVTVAQQLEDGRICKTNLTACEKLYTAEQDTTKHLNEDVDALKAANAKWQTAAGKRKLIVRIWDKTKEVAAIAGAAGLVYLAATKH